VPVMSNTAPAKPRLRRPPPTRVRKMQGRRMRSLQNRTCPKTWLMTVGMMGTGRRVSDAHQHAHRRRRAWSADSAADGPSRRPTASATRHTTPWPVVKRSALRPDDNRPPKATAHLGENTPRENRRVSGPAGGRGRSSHRKCPWSTSEMPPWCNEQHLAQRKLPQKTERIASTQNGPCASAPARGLALPCAGVRRRPSKGGGSRNEYQTRAGIVHRAMTIPRIPLKRPSPSDRIDHHLTETEPRPKIPTPDSGPMRQTTERRPRKWSGKTKPRIRTTEGDQGPVAAVTAERTVSAG